MHDHDVVEPPTGEPADGPCDEITYRVAPDTRLLWVSEGFTRALGWTAEQLIGTPGSTLVHPEDRPLVAQGRQAFLARGSGLRPVGRIRRASGDYRWYAIEAEREFDESGAIVSVRARLTEVDQAEAARDALVRSEARLRQLVDSMGEAVVHQVGGVVMWASASLTRLLGWAPEELVGRPSAHLWHADDLDRAEAVRDAGAAGATASDLLRIQHRDGHYVHVGVTAAPDGGDPPGIVVTLRDASAEVHAREALEQRETEYRLLAENSVDLVVRTSLEGYLEWVSPSSQRLLGRAPEDLVGREMEELVHPDDRARRRAERSAARSGETVAFEARYQHADGHWVWLSLTAGPYRDGSGRVVGLVGSGRDITAEVAAREALQASEEMFRQVMEYSQVGMAVVSLEGRFLAVNPTLCQIIGATEEWLLERNAADLLHASMRPTEVSEVVDPLFEKGVSGPSVLRLVRADGNDAWVRRTALVVRAEDGAPRYIVAQVEDISSERAARDELAYQALHDPMTGLRNRSWIIEILDEELAVASQVGGSVGLLFLDLDNMKVVNDSLGHGPGDEVILEVGRRLAVALTRGEHLGRFGGDEFVVVVPEVRDPRTLERLADRVLAAVSDPVEVQGHQVVPSASAGIAVSVAESTSASLLRDADAALSRAKASGRARWHFFDEQMHADAVARLTIEDELRRAIAAGQLVVHYQPIVSLADRSVVGHEALVRWQHPLRGLVPPLDFLPVAEESGLITTVGQVVLDQVLTMLAARPDLPGTVSVNLSPRELRRADWRLGVSRLLAHHQVSPHRLVLEVTETAALSLDEGAQQSLEDIRAMGVGIHVDDFGIGYSSISLLRDLPVTGLKLDASFTRRLTGTEDSADALAAGLAGLAQGLHLTSIAEGIETEEQASILAAQGWACGQGWLFGRPGPEPIC